MSSLFEYLLSVLFPPKIKVIETWEVTQEVSNYSQLDPFRPLGRWDSWAGHIKCNLGESQYTS